MRKNKSIVNTPIEIMFSTFGLASAEQLVQNSTDGSFIAVLNEATDGLRLAKVREIKIPDEQREEDHRERS